MNNATLCDQGFHVEHALGRLVFKFAHLETSLGCAVGYLANPKESRVGQILVAELSFKSRLAVFSTLYPERITNAPASDKLKAFLSRAHYLEDQRNSLIHSFYRAGSVGDPTATRIKATAKESKGLRIQFEQITAQSILAEADKIPSVEARLNMLMVEADDYTRYAAGFYSMLRRNHPLADPVIK